LLVFAVQGANIFPGASSGTNFSYSGSGTLIQVQPGNISFIEVSGTMAGSSGGTHWAGFYGNISGNMSLEDANGHVFYDWVGIGSNVVGEVFASNVSTVIWSGVNCTNSSQITAINSFMNVTGTDKDSVELTYTSNIHPAFNVAGINIPANTCNSTNAFSDGIKNSSLFSQILLADTNDCPVFTTLINSSSVGFAGDTVDFELLSGVKKNGLTSLYFFIELG
jgi:hypothetical protein